LYLDPQDPTTIQNQIEKLIANKDLRIEMIQKGKEHIRQFSWDKCGKETLAVLQNC
jgi:glycosyltransferase involved in cell wall biosynthesis